MMLATLARKELASHLASFRFLFSAVILVVLAVLATLVAATDYRLRLADYQSRVEEHRQQVEATRVYSFLQPVLTRAPEPLSIFDHGFEGRLGNEVGVSVQTIPANATAGERGNPFLGSSRGLDLTTIVIVVLGLLALLLTFDAVVSEKGSGNLQLVLANGVSRSKVLLGKLLGAFAALASVLLAGTSASLAVALGRVPIELDAVRWGRLGGLFVAYLLYLALMVLLGLLLSTTARSASSALVRAMLAWLVVVFLIPQAALALAAELMARAHDPRLVEEAVVALEDERDALLEELWHRDPLISTPSGHSSPVVETNLEGGVLRRYGSGAYYDALTRYYRRETEIVRRYAERIYEARRGHEQQLRRVERLAGVLALASPAFLLDRVSESFSGTTLEDQEAFLSDARAYRESLLDYLASEGAFGSWRWFTDDPRPPSPWPSLFGLEPEEVDGDNIASLARRFREPEIQSRLAVDADSPERRLQLADLPAFEPRQVGIVGALRRAAPEIVSLAVIDALLVALALFLFQRYELR